MWPCGRGTTPRSWGPRARRGGGRGVRRGCAVLAALGGGWQVGLGAHAMPSADGALLHLIAVVASLDGMRLIRVEREGSARRPAALGRAVARALLRQGAAAILGEILGGAERAGVEHA